MKNLKTAYLYKNRLFIQALFCLFNNKISKNKQRGVLYVKEKTFRNNDPIGWDYAGFYNNWL